MTRPEDLLASGIVAKIRAIIGETAATIARNVEGISVGKDGLISATGFSAIDSLVKSYEKILGPVARTFAIEVAQEAFSGLSGEELGKIAGELPVWAKPSASAKLAGLFEAF